MKKSGQHIPKWIYIGILVVMVCGVWWIWWNWGINRPDMTARREFPTLPTTQDEASSTFLYEMQIANLRGVKGDQFGGVNSLFTGLAFAFFAVTLLMQMEGLRIQHRELQETQETMKASVDAQRMSAFIAAFPTIMEQLNTSIKNSHAMVNVMRDLATNAKDLGESKEEIEARVKDFKKAYDNAGEEFMTQAKVMSSVNKYTKIECAFVEQYLENLKAIDTTNSNSTSDRTS